MAFTYADLKSEVKRRATKNQGGSQFDPGIGNVINTSLWRVAREAKWRSLRRHATFNTVGTYSTGTGFAQVTFGSRNVTVTGATFLTDGIRIGRYITLGGSTRRYKIATITGETTLTLEETYDGTTSLLQTYSILGQGEYVLPIQVGHSAFLLHNRYGAPSKLEYMPTQEFFSDGLSDNTSGVPSRYRMWGMDSALEQLKAPSVITVSSSSTTDTAIAVTIFGTVAGYPDYEIITTNGTDGTTAVVGSKTFTTVERITKNQTTTGRITCSANSANTIVGVLPVGATTVGPYYTKIQLYPLPIDPFQIQVYYYKKPFMLVNDGDVHELGEEFSEAIILLATAKLKAEQNQKEDADFFRLYLDEIATLKSTNVDKIDWKIKLKRSDDWGAGYWGWGVNYNQIGGTGTYGPSHSHRW